VLSCVVVGIIGVLWCSSRAGYFISFPVTYNNANHPVVDVKFGSNTYDLEVRVGSRFPLFLSLEALDQIEKNQIATLNGMI